MTNKGDLISRSALKEDMVSGCRRIGEVMGVVLPTLAFVNIIDNAQPVEQNWRFYYDHGYAQAKRDFERPHGEWGDPFFWNGKTYHKCTNCHISSELILIDKYCPNCGAKMYGGEEE